LQPGSAPSTLAGPRFQVAGAHGHAHPRHLLLKASDAAATARALEACGGRKVGEVSRAGVWVVAVPGHDVPGALQKVLKQSGIEIAEEDAQARAMDLVPDDPGLASQWGLMRIQAPAAWGRTTGSSGVPIAILDSGIDQDHEDLPASKIVATANFSTSSTADDMVGHGTHCAGIAAAATNNALGVAGAGFGATLMNVKVLDDDGSGSYSAVANGLYWATDHGAKVISMSLAGTVSSRILKDAVNYAARHGVILAAAAGNDGAAFRTYPAAYTPCIAVAATDANDHLAPFSNFSSRWVDVAAPGVDIYSTLPNHPNAMGTLNYGTLSGTSMATPFVAGEAALIWAVLGTRATASAVRARLESTCDRIKGTGRYWSKGRINMARAVMR
jgi:thermitase